MIQLSVGALFLVIFACGATASCPTAPGFSGVHQSVIGTLQRLQNNLRGWDPPINFTLTTVSNLAFANHLCFDIPYIQCTLTLQTCRFLEKIIITQPDMLEGTIPEDVFAQDSSDDTLAGFAVARLKEIIIKDQPRITGNIPESLFRLNQDTIQSSAITTLVVSNTSMGGSLVPDSTHSEAIMLDFSNNKLTGNIPSDLLSNSQKPRLRVLKARGNLMSGIIPQVNNPMLELDVSFNNFTGFEGQVAVKSLVASNNQLTTFPDIVFGAIHSLNLERNGIQSTLPPQLFSSATPLTLLHLGHNKFEGKMPLIDSSSKLSVIDIQDNIIRGRLPLNIFQLRNLTEFRANRNFLYFTIPSLPSFSAMEHLDLQDNYFSVCPEDLLANITTGLKTCVLDCNHFHDCATCDLSKLSACITEQTTLCTEENTCRSANTDNTLPPVLQPVTSEPTPQSPPKDIIPIRQCVRTLPNNTGWELYFGYNNQGGARTIEAGSVNNRVFPPPTNQHNISSFASGRSPSFPGYVFSLRSTGDEEFIRWIIGNQTMDSPPNSFISVIAPNNITSNFECPTEMRFQITVQGFYDENSINQILANTQKIYNASVPIIKSLVGRPLFKRGVPLNFEELEGVLNLEDVEAIAAARDFVNGVFDPALVENTLLQVLAFENLDATLINEQAGQSFLVVPTPPPPSGPVVVDTTNIGAIVGGITGAIILVLLIIVLIAFILYRNKKREFDKKLQEEFGMPMLLDNEWLTDNQRWLISYKDISFGKGDLLGQGKFGAVYKAKYQHSPVAIKMMKGIISEQVAPFLEEAKLMKALQPHSNIVQIQGFCMDPFPIIVIEFMPGGSLLDLIQKRRLQAHEINDLATGIAAGMIHLAAAHIVHRDLAARNILLTDGLVPKISDFGMSRLVIQDSDEVENGLKEQNVMGPIAWMAPETFRHQWTTKSDVWAFGILLWECNTRKNPAEEEPDINRLAVNIRDNGYHPKIPKKATLKMQELMGLCWKQKAKARPSFEEIAEILNPPLIETSEDMSDNRVTKYAPVNSGKKTKNKKRGKSKSKEPNYQKAPEDNARISEYGRAPSRNAKNDLVSGYGGIPTTVQAQHSGTPVSLVLDKSDAGGYGDAGEYGSNGFDDDQAYSETADIGIDIRKSPLNEMTSHDAYASIETKHSPMPRKKKSPLAVSSILDQPGEEKTKGYSQIRLSKLERDMSSKDIEDESSSDWPSSDSSTLSKSSGDSDTSDDYSDDMPEAYTVIDMPNKKNNKIVSISGDSSTDSM